MFTGKLEIILVSADLSSFTKMTGDKVEWKAENMNTLVDIWVDDNNLGSTETAMATDKYPLSL